MSIILVKPGSVSEGGLAELKKVGHIVLEVENKKDVQILDELAFPSDKELLEIAIRAIDIGDGLVKGEWGSLMRKKILERLKPKSKP